MSGRDGKAWQDEAAGRRALARAATAAAVLTLATAGAAAQTPGITIIEPASGYTHSHQLAVAANGATSIGFSYATGQPDRSYFWDRTAGVQEVALPAGVTYGRMTDISADGQWASSALTIDSVNTAARYSRATGLFQTVPMPTGYRKLEGGTVISGDGSKIVGSFDKRSPAFPGRTQAFIWSEAGGTQILPRLFANSNSQTAYAVNYDGSVVVGEEDQNNFAWKWTSGGGIVRLPGLGAVTDSVAPWAVTPDGRWIVGSALTATQTVMARWDEHNAIQNLGAIPGTEYGDAFAVSADGNTVAGTCYLFGGQPVATVWTPGTGTIRLSALLLSYGVTMPAGWNLAQVNDVSSDGRTFVGYAVNSSDTIARAFVATIPAPGVAATVLGVLGISLCRRRARL